MANVRKAQMRAKALREKHGITAVPVDVARLAELEGVQIDRTDFGHEVSGLLVKHGDRATIGVNARHAAGRQRFTIAHELGHFLLHSNRELFVDKDYVVHFRDENSSTGCDPVEVEANQFAAELIMPEVEVRQLFSEQRFDIDDEGALRKLARRFQVSPTAMAVRLSSLGLVVVS
jgi:Zn-dependent peptidase ImmA (M78 family)